jgi:hypothetical protein
MQLYANLKEESHLDFERMLYVFACISEKCIGTQRAIKVFRCVVNHKNPHFNFVENKEYDQVFG